MHTRFNPVATLFPVILIGMLAGMTYWLDVASRQQETTPDGRTRHDPDYYIERFEVRRFDKEGGLQHTLRAERMTHYPDDDSTVVQAPHLTYHHEPPTYVSAREAQVLSQGDHVQLIGDVQVTRAGVADRPPTILTTERLEAFPDEEIARTQDPVQIAQGRSQITGSGLTANNGTSLYVLDGPVHGVFFRKGKTIPPAAISAPAAAQAVPMAQPQAKPRTAGKARAAATPKAKPKAKPRAKP
jgi:lipopolysaccharide export system protein LptC